MDDGCCCGCTAQGNIYTLLFAPCIGPCDGSTEDYIKFAGASSSVAGSSQHDHQLVGIPKAHRAADSRRLNPPNRLIRQHKKTLSARAFTLVHRLLPKNAAPTAARARPAAIAVASVKISSSVLIFTPPVLVDTAQPASTAISDHPANPTDRKDETSKGLAKEMEFPVNLFDDKVNRFRGAKGKVGREKKSQDHAPTKSSVFHGYVRSYDAQRERLHRARKLGGSWKYLIPTLGLRNFASPVLSVHLVQNQ